MATINRITDVDIATAAAMDDLDSACGLLGALAGIPDGDIAASVFSDVHFDWRSASRTARAARIRSWLNMEHHHYG
jgi:hypothetical protein